MVNEKLSIIPDRSGLILNWELLILVPWGLSG